MGKVTFLAKIRQIQFESEYGHSRILVKMVFRSRLSLKKPINIVLAETKLFYCCCVGLYLRFHTWVLTYNNNQTTE